MQALQKHVGKKIRHIREQKGISQEALADMCNLHRTYIGLIERGQRNLTLSTLEVIARELEVPASDLFLDTEPPPSAKRPTPPRELVTLGDLATHVAVIRTILINTKLVDEAGYDALFKARGIL
jgi:transcriptional regulator with XRE-family HTH domain